MINYLQDWEMIFFNWLIGWCLTPTLAIFQLYRVLKYDNDYTDELEYLKKLIQLEYF